MYSQRRRGTGAGTANDKDDNNDMTLTATTTTADANFLLRVPPAPISFRSLLIDYQDAGQRVAIGAMI